MTQLLATARDELAKSERRLVSARATRDLLVCEAVDLGMSTAHVGQVAGITQSGVMKVIARTWMVYVAKQGRGELPGR